MVRFFALATGKEWQLIVLAAESLVFCGAEHLPPTLAGIM
jgi:hypothetical protein